MSGEVQYSAFVRSRPTYRLGLVLAAVVLAGPQPAQTAPSPAAATETRPVLVSRVDLERLSGGVVCVYNFSSW